MINTPQTITIGCRGALGCNSNAFHPQLAAGVRLVADAATSGTLRGLQQFAHAPNVVRDPSGHRRSAAQRFVDSAKVVERKPARDSGPVVLPFFTEAIGKAREATKAHPQRQVAAFHNRSADALRVRTAHDWDYLHGLNFGGAVAAFAFARCAVHFDELGEVATVMQGGSDRGTVRPEAVRGDLEATVRRRMADAFHEAIRCGLVTLPHGDIEHQLGMPLDCNEGVAVAKVLIVLGPNALLFLADEAPHFIGFHVAYLDINDPRRHDPFAFLASKYQQLQNRAVVDSGNALHGRNAGAFEQQRENRFGAFNGKVHAVKGLVLRLRKGFRAGLAAEALKPVAMLSEALALGTAVVACHSGLELSSSRVDNGSGPNIPSSGFGLRLNPVGSFNYLPDFSFYKQPQ